MKQMAPSETTKPASQRQKPGHSNEGGFLNARSLSADFVRTVADGRGRFARLLRWAVISAGTLLACSCASGGGHRPQVGPASLDPFLEQPSAVAALESPLQNRPAGSRSEQISPQRAAPVRTALRRVPAQLDGPVNSPEGIGNRVVPAEAFDSEDAGTVRSASWSQSSHSGPNLPRQPHGLATHVTPVQPRIELVSAADPFSPFCDENSIYNGENGGGPIAEYRPSAGRGGVDDYPDEYLLDGGDRALPIHYDRFNRLGIDTEDAVAEYVDHLGGRHVKPTNRVAIYAPRFGAVRSMTAPGGETSIVLFEGMTDVNRAGGVRNRLSPDDQTNNDAADRMRVRSRASGLDGGTDRRGVHQMTALAEHTRGLVAFEDLAFIGSGRFAQAERARLATGIQAAVEWSQANSPVIVAQADGLQEAYNFFKPQELIGSEDQMRTKGDLRIVKLADRKTASPGDVVTFAIRYDNLGDRELHHIRIIDNLTPRLEYVDDSATSDRAGRLDVEDNEEGTLLLKFVLDDPLPGHAGGVITFQARVR